MSTKRTSSTVFLLCAVVGCTDTPTGIQLRFVADQALNTEAQVMKFINHIEVMVSKSGGFEGSNSAFQPVDLDGDSVKELVLSRSLPDDELRFPLYRLLAGGQPEETEIEIWARGLTGDETEIAAVSDRVSAVFRANQDEEATLRFNLRSRYRAPRVTLTLPHAGQQKVPRALGEIKVEFSTRLKAATVPGNLVVIYSGTAGERRLDKDSQWQLTFNSVSEHGLDEQTTTASLVLNECSLSPGNYRIEATTKITDSSERPLDQDARKSGANGFVASFSVQGEPQANPCGIKVTCTTDKDCNEDDASKQYVCVKDDPVAEGSCQALPASCNDNNCPPGYVCNNNNLTGVNGSIADSNGQCERDCRTNDAAMTDNSCPNDLVCDQSTGVCVSSSSSTTCEAGNCSDCPTDSTCDPDNTASCFSAYNNAGCPSGAGCDTTTGSCVWCTTQSGCCATDTTDPNGGQSSDLGTCDLSTSYCDPYSGDCVPFSEGAGIPPSNHGI